MMSTPLFALPHVRSGRSRVTLVALICAAMIGNLALLAGSAHAAALPAGATIIGYGSSWQFWRSSTPPKYDWVYINEASPSWATRQAPFGTGADADIRTTLSAPSASLMSTYYRMPFTLDKSTLTDGATLTVQVDDGATAYVNGHEVGRQRMANNTGYTTAAYAKAQSGVTRADAVAYPTAFAVPQNYLLNGKNVISIMSVAAGSSSNVSFDAKLTAGGGGLTATVEHPTTGLQAYLWEDFDNWQSYDQRWTEENNSPFGWNNKQLECNQQGQVNLRGSGKGETSYLEITAIKQHTDLCGYPANQGSGPREYASGMTSTQGKVVRMYGLIEMRAKLPVGQGTSQGMWPAFWLRPADEGEGEIDILEGLGSPVNGEQSQSIVHQALHAQYGNAAASTNFNYLMPEDQSMADGDWHLYSVEWSPTQIRFFVDNVMTFKVSASDPQYGQYFKQVFVNKGYYIRLNLAVGGNWPGSPDANTRFPANYQIDYVAWYGGQAPPA